MDEYQPIEIQDKGIFTEYLAKDPQVISEMTFTNLFMWRHRYRPRWRIWEKCLLIIMKPKDLAPFGLPPIGPGDKTQALAFLCGQLKKLTPKGMVCRVPEEFVNKYVDPDHYEIRLDRDNSDYVYLAQDLIKLSGRKYHRKKNQLNKFLKTYSYEYRDLDVELVECFLDLQETWCQLKKCQENPSLLMEDYAIHQTLPYFEELDLQGGAILIDDKVEAFTLGEPIGKDSAVIHIEKANPDIPGLYTAINQLFCLKAWSSMKYINREQDLGIEGLKKAKESYYPHHMVNKYILTSMD